PKPETAQTGVIGRLACRHIGGEILEKIVSDLLGRAIDQTLTELGELAADLRLDVVSKQRTAILFRQRDGRPAFGKAGNPAVALARYLIAVGRVEIGEMNLAFETRLHGTYFGDSDRLQFGIGNLIELLAAGNAGF